MNLMETIELIQRTAVQAGGAQLLEESPDGRSATYSQNGERFTVERCAPCRDHVVESLEDLIRYTKNFTEDGCPAVWHSAECVTLLCDDADRRDRVRFLLPWSDPFGKLRVIDDCENRFDQFTFIRLLHRTLSVDPATVAKFRRLDFKVIQAAEGELQHGKERLGKSINAEVKGTTEIPEELTASVPVYDARGERDRRAILCGIDLDAQRAQILFRPLPGELARAIESAQESIRERLVDELEGDAQIYRGTP